MDKFFNKIDIINVDTIKKCLDKTSKDYRPYDPGWYLYKKLNELRKKQDIFSDDYLELVYVTLSSWNMNSRAAKLADFSDFKDIIRGKGPLIHSLENDKLSKLNVETICKLESLFQSFEGICHQKSKIVTFSKTLHFLLPELAVPIDRKYTLNFFNNNSIIPNDLDKQFVLYKNILLSFSRLAQKYDFSKYVDNGWNQNIPKILDNLIIGYMKLK